MQVMNFMRLANWKCQVCGSRHKDVNDIVGTNGEIIMKISVCCRCGNVMLYANTAKSVAGFLLNNFTMVRKGLIPEETESLEQKELLENRSLCNPIKTNI